MIHDLIRQARANAKENGYEAELQATTLQGQAADLVDFDAALQGYKFKEVYDALLDVLLETDVAYFLNKMQLEGRKHRLLDPVHAIKFALQDDDGLNFLRYWNEGEWSACHRWWPEWRDFQ